MKLTEIKKIEEILLLDKPLLKHKVGKLASPVENGNSFLLNVDLRLKNDKNFEEKLEVVAKLASRNINEAGKAKRFQNEITFYNSVVPLMQEFRKLQGVEAVGFFPKYYGGRLTLNSRNREADQDGFINLEPHIGFNLEITKLILQQLSRFHASFLAIKLKKPQVFKHDIKPYINKYDVSVNVDDIKHVVSLLWGNEGCVSLIPRVRRAMSRKTLPPREPISTIIHNDLWTRNVMVKLEGADCDSVRFVDFQHYDYGSPAADVLFFLFTSTELPVLEDHLDELLKYYFTCFASELHSFEIEDPQFSFEDFLKEVNTEFVTALFPRVMMKMDEIFKASQKKEEEERVWYTVQEFAKLCLGHKSKMTEEIKRIEEILLPKYLSSKEHIIHSNTTRLTAAGENYGSLMLAVDIKIRNKENGKERILHVVGKAVPRNEFIQKMFQSPLTFKKELEFYRTRQNGIKEVMDFFPEFYGGRMGMTSNPDEFDDDAVILLENLKMEGYFCVDRTIGFDLDTAKYLIKNLATFHAVPLALKLKNPELFKKKILPNINTLKIFDGLGDDLLENVIDGYITIAKENEECIPFLPRIKKKLFASAKFVQNPSPPREPFSTLVHIDFWVNNTMIKAEEGKVIGNKIVDFQMPEYGSPARDLTFFIFDSIQNDVVLKYYDDLVEFYHQNFVDTLKQFGVDTTPFSFDAFQKEIDTVMNQEFVLFQCFVMLKAIFATKESVKEIENMSMDDFKDNNVISQQYKEKLWLLVKEFAKRKWF
ncbi:hypothetical protein NQ315_017185 [Exocentrus adspersus]|uniref:CHK kinase-like domain-containing protein n=1 Tax=Exocentrus adspersus TaxID=1586481 RepID=A0AAV8VGD3_9CUCU|nr:hypothetical protein NQ315_017185 [Exocentrus adspersus]